MSKKQKLDLTDFLTTPLRDEETTSIISNLFNRFLSEERSVRVNGQVGGKPSPENADLESSNLNRELNALVPALYYKTGTEEHVFTFEDLVNRMSAIGINTNNLREMLSEQNYNYVPPINLDKFVNYSSYYWAPNTTSIPQWNTDLLPEYYLIEPPASTSTFKMPVKVATTRDIKLWAKDRSTETITVTFTSAFNFTVTGSNGTILSRTVSTIGAETTSSKNLISTTPGAVTSVWVVAPDYTSGLSGGYGLQDLSTWNDILFTFTVTNGTAPFVAGDSFAINITYVTGANTIAFTSVNQTDKGFISNITPDLRFMSIDGIELQAGDAVLVKNQLNPEENGVYTVTSTKWVHRLGANTSESLPLNSLVYVNGGLSLSGRTYELSVREPDETFIMDDPVHGDQTWTLFSSNAASPVNEWQEYNFWVHIDDLPDQPASVQAIATQAKRPIIEYDFGIELNSMVDSNGYPAVSGISYTQKKVSINQLPQFNMYRYNGTHARRTSAIFFYAEDPDYPIDVELQRRVKTNSNPDYVFAQGVEDQVGRLLFWKKDNVLCTIWTAGPQGVPNFDEFINSVNALHHALHVEPWPQI